MQLQKTNTLNPIRGVLSNPRQSQKRECYSIIANLEFADLGRGAGTLYTEGTARLDMQGHTATEVNLQVQIGTNTVAAALVSQELLNIKDEANQRGVANGVISVLNQSMDTGTIWRLS